MYAGLRESHLLKVAHGHYIGEIVAHPPLGKIVMAAGQPVSA